MISILSKKHNKPEFICLMVLVVTLSFFIAGCAVPRYHTGYKNPDFDINKIRTIAVLPFSNFTTDKYAGEKIRRTTIIEILSRGLDVVEPGEVTKVLNELRESGKKKKSRSSISSLDLQNIGKRLGVEALLKGSVSAYGISRGVTSSYPEVSINLMLIEAASGDIIWSVSHTGGGTTFWTRHFGSEGLTLDATVRIVVREAVDPLFIE